MTPESQDLGLTSHPKDSAWKSHIQELARLNPALLQWAISLGIQGDMAAGTI